MQPDLVSRPSRFRLAQKRTREDGVEERYCTICGAWDSRKQSAWYVHHGVGKCDKQPAGGLLFMDADDTYEGTSSGFDGGDADGAGGSGPYAGGARHQSIEQGAEEGRWLPAGREEQLYIT